MSKGLRETLKTALRGLYFALLGTVGTFLASLATNQSLLNEVVRVPGTEIYLQVGVALGAALAAIAKSIDRYRHTSEKTTSNGIAPAFLQR